MGTFMTAQLVVWLAVLLYVGRLGLKQRALAQRLDSLELQSQETAACRTSAKAA